MKNKNGFIATGLIYSFFLIFLTLFLTVITKNIKNKVSLNYVEDEIKSNLNANKSVRDFKVGDLVYFASGCTIPSDYATMVENLYVVARVETDNVVCGGTDNCLVLYSFGLTDSDTDALNFSDLEKDISTGYMNGTYVNKILYTFDTDTSEGARGALYYKFKDQYYAELSNYDSEVDSCVGGIKDVFCNDFGKITNDLSDGKYRKRVVKGFSKIKVCKLEKDGMGVIYVDGSI